MSIIYLLGKNARELGLLVQEDDSFQVSLSNIPSPQAGKSYYAWLLPDRDQSEANPRALGVLVISNCAAAINQLNALCHLRHLLSGDPELARVNLPGNWSL